MNLTSSLFSGFLKIVALLGLIFSPSISFAEANVTASNCTTLVRNLKVGVSGEDVRILQKLLNGDEKTLVARSGPGSFGMETTYFGEKTRDAVVRFQNLYKEEILFPVELTAGNGFVGSYTRAKLLTICASSPSKQVTVSVLSPVATLVPTSPTGVSATDYRVIDPEKIDIYAGDKMIEDVQKRITAAINSAIASQSTATATMPTITQADVPSVVMKALSPQSGIPGTRVSVTGMGFSQNSVIYFGVNYIVRTVSQSSSEGFSFIIPSIPPGRYDTVVRTGGKISNTTTFVITDPRNPSVHLESVSPATITYGGTLTITGSGFSPQNNVVVTTFQKFTNVPSADGKTLTLVVAPESLRENARVGRGTDNIPMSLYIVNEYGFSDSEKLFTMIL